MAFSRASFLRSLQLEHIVTVWAPGKTHFFQIQGSRRGTKFCAGGILVNAHAVQVAPILYKFAIGRSFAVIEDHCFDNEWDFLMFEEKKGKIVEIEWRQIGFTGTQEGMTAPQKRTLRELLKLLRKNDEIIFFRHGDCVGSDEEAHALALDLHYSVIIHPPEDEKKRAFCEEAFTILEPKPYRERNLRIVQKSHILLAAPKGLAEEQRSGTWSTVRAANNLGVPVRIIFPDGSFRKGMRK